MEAPTFLNTIIALFVLGLFRDVSMQSDCGFYIEEGIRWLLTCGTRTAQFTSFGPRVEIDGQILDVGHCDSDGNCISPYPSNFGVTSGTNETTGRKEVTVTIYSANRTMTRTHCYRDGIPINGVECLLNIYDSAQFPGDKEVTCQLRIQIVGIPENLYRFRPVLFPENAPNIASAITYGDTMPPLSLWRTVLSDEAENDRVFNFPESDELLVTIPVTGNPQPNRFSLNVRYTNTSAPSPMPDEDYSAIFNPSTSNSRGVITLTISAGLKRDQTSRFSFKADNGVVGRSALEYNFSVLKLYSK
ncbi:hypothetical protein PoB_005158100 [Plakobranchus ocellatus]|uniref:Uncharacterized protein n=1 Tax=Plakobranchus ocellatus TaxID=259542 RepID=A0AAV4BPA2_9GAST|nr:hypothetical protein PoB_005158100 [Plakobranchus ocellatus]